MILTRNQPQPYQSPSPASTNVLGKVPLPAVIGAVSGCVVIALVISGLLVYKRSRRLANQKFLTDAAPQGIPTLPRKQTDAIAEMTQVGIHLNTSSRNEPIFENAAKRASSKPKFINTMAAVASPLKMSFSESGAAGSPVKPAVVVFQRKQSVSAESAGGADGRKRSIIVSSSARKASIYSITQARKASLALVSPLPSKKMNGIQSVPEDHSLPPGVAESLESIASSVSITSDDMEADTELEQKYEVTDPWVPQRFDELELIPGDTVIVYEIFGDGWCDGRVEGQEETGAFPMACLKKRSWSIVQEEPEEGSMEDLPLAEVSKRLSLVSEKIQTTSKRGSQQSTDAAQSNSSKRGSTQSQASISPSVVSARNRYSIILKNVDKYAEEASEHKGE
ncbi:hypothetical protein HDU98_004476 [Podochytrium sp. JEL0797]|nr:hypothetical protein HDU98_004476 [Podochytrium sp. JEL0797]